MGKEVCGCMHPDCTECFKQINKEKLYRHKGNGFLYRKICRAKLQSNGIFHVVYESMNNMKYIRPAEEFARRFEKVHQ